MTLATHRWAALLLLGALVSTPALAQSDPLGDEFILFVDGTNVMVPGIEGGTNVPDPLDADNRVMRFTQGNWAETGFAWPRLDGIDAAANVGAAYGEGDTLYVRMLSDPANQPLTGVAILIADATDDVGAPRADVEAGTITADYLMRLVWNIPPELHDGQWHDLAIPLPPATYDALETARANGELMDGAENWQYTGAWSTGGFGIGTVGSYDPPTSDPLWAEFGWEQLYRIGPFWDNSAGGTGGPIYFDNVYIGGPSTDISTATEAPTAMSGVTFSPTGSTNTVSWSAIDGAGGYNVYVSLDPISDVEADGVTLLKRVLFDEPTQFEHRYERPHPSLGAQTLYYAVTTLSNFGVENPDVSASAGSIANGDIETRAWIRGLTGAEADAIFEDIDSGTVTDANFPADQPVFVLDTSHRTEVEGTLNPTDDDVSGRFMIGYSDLEEWFIYGEITDDDFRPAPESEVGSNTYLYDSVELAFGHYDLRTVPGGDILNGSPHEDFERGDEPDYQIRIAGKATPGGAPAGASTWVGFSIEEDFENATIVEATDTGWRFLTLLPMDQIQNTAEGDVLLPVPGPAEIQYIPFTISINDADATGQRESQIILSVKPNVTNQWWNTPSQYEVIAIAGRDLVSTAEDGAPNGEGFSLAQSVPNPTTGSAQVAFTLGTPGPAQVDVFNTLGQRVASVATPALAAGEHTVSLDLSGLASGVYVYRLTAGDYVATRRMTVVR